jgi:hypothetical protein
VACGILPKVQETVKLKLKDVTQKQLEPDISPGHYYLAKHYSKSKAFLPVEWGPPGLFREHLVTSLIICENVEFYHRLAHKMRATVTS